HEEHPDEEQPRAGAFVRGTAPGAEEIQPARRKREAVPGQGRYEPWIERLEDSDLMPPRGLAARGPVVGGDEATTREAAAEEIGVLADLPPGVALDDGSGELDPAARCARLERRGPWMRWVGQERAEHQHLADGRGQQGGASEDEQEDGERLPHRQGQEERQRMGRHGGWPRSNTSRTGHRRLD